MNNKLYVTYSMQPNLSEFDNLGNINTQEPISGTMQLNLINNKLHLYDSNVCNWIELTSIN